MKLSRNILLLTWLNIFFCIRLFTVVMILYFAEVTGSYALALSIFSISQLTQALFEVPAGILSDRFGRKRCAQLGALAIVFAVLFYAIGGSYLLLLIGAIFMGICNACYSGNNDALLYESLAETGHAEKYHTYLGKMSSWMELAGFVSAIVGGLIAVYSLQLLFWISIFPQIISFGISFWIVEPVIHKEQSDNVFAHLKEALSYYRKNMRLRNISLASILSYGIGQSNWAFQATFYNSLLPVWATSWVMSLNFLASTISFRVSGWLIDKFKALNVLIYQEIYTRALYIFAVVFPTILSPFIIAASSISYGPETVAKNTLLQKEFSDKQRATMASINSLFGSIFFAIFAVLIGLVADKIGPGKSLLIGQICLLPVLFLYVTVFRHEKKSGS